MFDLLEFGTRGNVAAVIFQNDIADVQSSFCRLGFADDIRNHNARHRRMLEHRLQRSLLGFFILIFLTVSGFGMIL